MSSRIGRRKLVALLSLSAPFVKAVPAFAATSAVSSSKKKSLSNKVSSSHKAIASQPWCERGYHRQWLMEQASDLFTFFQNRCLNPKGGFFELGVDGSPINPSKSGRELASTARMVHSFAIGCLLGRPGADAMVDHGMNYLWNQHRDSKNGGYFWKLNDTGVIDSTKKCYGHAFVLLAASSAKLVGHPLADKLLTDVTEVIEKHFWEEAHGAMAEEFKADWTAISSYHGQNSNMHMTEALMAAFEATGNRAHLAKAERIADLIINRNAAKVGFRVAEHFDANWNIDKGFVGDSVFLKYTL